MDTCVQLSMKIFLVICIYIVLLYLLFLYVW